MRATLLQRLGKVGSQEFHEALGESLSNLKGDLTASFKLIGFSDAGWAKIDVEGQDSEIVLEMVSRELGRAQTDLAKVEAQGNYSGVVCDIETDLEVDIGIEHPAPLNVKINPRALRAQLCDGKPFSVREIADYYGLGEGSKVTVRLTRLEAERLEGWLADTQIDLFKEHIDSRLERVQVFNCVRQRLEFALRRANLERDVISVESNTLTTHSVVCKLGTNAIGILPKLGSTLRKSELKPFLPNRILKECRQW
jgi:hypothetical protein